MHQVLRRHGNMVLEMDLRSKRGRYVIHDPVNHTVPLMRTDDYQRAADTFTVRVELRRAREGPKEFAHEPVASRDGRRLVRTVDRDADGLRWKYIAIDGNGNAVDLGDCLRAMIEFFGQALVSEVTEGSA